MGKPRLIPKTHCICIVMWYNPDQTSTNEYLDYDPHMSSMQTGAASLTKAMKIVRNALATGHYTHFLLSYPVSMHGMTNGFPYDLEGLRTKKRHG